MPTCSRFRALKLWFVMRRFGTTGLRDHVRSGLRLARHFAIILKRAARPSVGRPMRLATFSFGSSVSI